MPKLSKTEKMYIKLIKRDYEITLNAIQVAKYRLKKTYKQLYLDMCENEKNTIELQTLLCDKEYYDIMHLFNEKHNEVAAKKFLIRLYSIELTKPMNTQFVDRLNYLLSKLRNS